MTTLIIDVETVPVQRPDHLQAIAADMAAELDAALATLRAPANYKDAEKIDAYVVAARAQLASEHVDKVQAAIDKTSFDGGLGQIAVIGWAVNDEAPQSMRVNDLSHEQERALLRDWFEVLNQLHRSGGQRPLIVGHNVVAFDLPFIWKRAMIHGVRPPMWMPRDPKPWGESVYDTMTQWAGARDRISLDRLCRVLGIEGKTGITGADVWPMVRAGKMAEVAAYCEHDIEITRAVYWRMTFAEAQQGLFA